MKLQDFDYVLPDELIATKPLPQRDLSRLLYIKPPSTHYAHLNFVDICSVLGPNDVLVLNNTEVIKSRLFATKKTGAKIELLLIKEIDSFIWSAFLKPAKRVSVDDVLVVSDDFKIKILKKEKDNCTVKIISNVPVLDLLTRYGHVPIPPYIISGKETPSTFKNEYQTVFSSEPGAVAAPTAGLHFTPSLLSALTAKGVTIETLTLHVGPGTFQPIKVENVMDHTMHYETYTISPDVARRLSSYLGKKRIVAVGTTSVRALESAYKNGIIQSGSYETNLFITPGYSFKVINGLITNFHLPKSSLLLLVSAFAGYSLIKSAYQEAIRNRYRFYSFGDAMLILP